MTWLNSHPSPLATWTKRYIRGQSRTAKLAAHSLVWRKGHLGATLSAASFCRKDPLLHLRAVVTDYAPTTRANSIVHLALLTNVESEVTINMLLACTARTDYADGWCVVSTVGTSHSLFCDTRSAYEPLAAARRHGGHAAFTEVYSSAFSASERLQSADRSATNRTMMQLCIAYERRRGVRYLETRVTVAANVLIGVCRRRSR